MDNEETPKTNIIDLKSTIINQKKKLFLYVTQSKDLVWPNKTYDYQVYVKNISGQTIKNLKIYITNPKEVVIEERDERINYLHSLRAIISSEEENFDEEYLENIIQLINRDDFFERTLTSEEIFIIEQEIQDTTDSLIRDNKKPEVFKIPTLKSGQSVVININDCLIMQEGYYYVNFVAMGDETEIKTQSLMIKCGYENDNKNILHRIAFYNFHPYESAYMQRASDFNENVTQLTKIQTKPFEAYNQPFEMDSLELDLYAQDIFLTNTDDMPSMYLGRENWESNLEEGFVGQSLINLIQKINKESNLVEIDFLRTGNNEMLTDFQQIFPNGFIHRFGLLKSEFYKLLGIIPKIYSINDDLFRWARRDDEPVVYPKRENDKWNQKPWCGTGYYVYESKIENNKKAYTIERAIFTTKEDAEFYVNNLNTFNSLNFIEDIVYEIKKRDWLPGIFYVEIPLRDIPANFYIPDVDQIQAVIELVKPYGLKGYPRFVVNNEFIHQMTFSATPTISPYTMIDLGEEETFIDYHVRQKKYQQVMQDGIETIRLCEYGLQADKISFVPSLASFFSYSPKPSIYAKFIQKIKYFLEDNEVYAHIYPLERAEKLQELGIITIRTNQDELLSIIESDAIKIDGIYLNADIKITDEDDDSESQSIYQEQKFYIQDIYDGIVTLPDEFLVVVNAQQNPDEQYNIMNLTSDFRVLCNTKQKSFDGQVLNNNSINNLLMKNPEDISFYIQNYHFVEDYEFEAENIKIPLKYKTLNYYDEETSVEIDLGYDFNNAEQNLINRPEPSAIKLSKQPLPQHVNVNLLFSKADRTQDFIISYKLLYDDVYEISYKTYKKSEIVVKEIVTQFDYILCEINNISLHKDLVKIYYGLGDKTYFITSFISDILSANGYQTRISLTNDLTLHSIFEFETEGNLSFGNMTLLNTGGNNELQYPHWYLANKKYSNIISTDNYQIKEIPKQNTSWKNLYRINKDETSFALFENEASEKTQINDIELFLGDLNIPRNSVIDKIYTTVYADSREEVFVYPSYQTNTNIINNISPISSMFNIKSYEIYTKNNQKYLYQQLSYYIEKDNENQIEYYKALIDASSRQNEITNINFSKDTPMEISNNFWNEVSFDKTDNLKTSEVKSVYLILEGYNSSNNVEAESQLVNYDGVGNSTKINIDAGYFYKKIPINYDTKYDISELSIRFKFNNVQHINLYNVKSEIFFTEAQNIERESISTEKFSINGLDKYSCILCENIDGDDVLNGLTIKLGFDSVQNYLKIYSVVVNIIYHEKAFTNIIETSPDFNTVSGANTGTLRCNIFDEKVSDMRQDTYTTTKPNGEYDSGFVLDRRVYQAFTAEEDNITSIELRPNGKIGAPDRYLKVAILDNYDNLPNNVLKEVIIDMAKIKLIDNEAYKYNIYVNNLIIGDTYWFSIEPVDKTKNGAYRFLYNHYQVDNFKLLSTHNGDVINQHASLYFRLYSKQNNYSFNQLPYKFEIENDYTKDINLITEIQVYDGYIKDLTQSLFGECAYSESTQVVDEPEEDAPINVTITTINPDNDTPMSNVNVFLFTGSISNETMIAGGITQDDGTCILCDVDVENESFTDNIANIAEGDYLVIAYLNNYSYSGEIHVDSDNNEFELRLEIYEPALP